MPQMRIRLLGGFEVEVDGTVIPESAWRLRKSRSVLKLLALADGRGLHVERLQSLLWPDRDPASAANNLRQAVYQARRALTAAGADGAAIVRLRDDLLELATEVEVDVDEFERAAAEAERTPAADGLQAAIAAYGGELLPEDIYEDWAEERRRALAERHVYLMLELAATQAPAEAVATLTRVLAAEPLNEHAHRELMRAYAASGRRNQALEHYDALRTRLDHELAADPEPETRALYRELLAAGAPQSETATAERTDRVPAQPTHNFPWQPTSFVGRRRELEELERLLSARRLITLTGPGGCGKTRLAFELGRARAGCHTDGAWVVELAGIAAAGLVPQAVAYMLGLDLTAAGDPLQELAHHLAQRDLLLVLDNCEHLLAACARLVDTLLPACPRVRILVTSRQPLHLPGEVDWRVPSLSLVPAADATDASEAMELFRDRAESANPRFRLSDENAEAVAAICRRLDGLPLALELAAARTAALAPAEILARLQEGLDVLRSARPAHLTRQQTLQATLDWSHDLLADAERVLFRRLAVFSGGFELRAAEVVCAGAPIEEHEVLELLSSLVDKSLVTVEDLGSSYRYRLLEPVRQYAAQKLAAAGEGRALPARHADWFAELAAAPGGCVTDADPRWIDELERDYDNLRAALAWTLVSAPERALEMAGRIAGVWLLRGNLREGCSWLDAALAAAPAATIARAEALHARQALERRRPESYDLADSLGEERVGIHQLRGDRRGEALALLDLTDGYLLRGRFDAAAGLVAGAAAIAEALGDPALAAAAQERTGLAASLRGDLAAADDAFTRALELNEAAPANAAPASAVVSLACFLASAARVGDYPVIRFEETALHIRRLPPRAAAALVRSHRAYLLRSRARFDDARRELDLAFDAAQSRGDELESARLLCQRGALEITAGDLDAAQEHLAASLALRRRLRDHRGTLLALVNSAVAAHAQGDSAAAERVLNEAWRMAEAAADGPGTGGVLLARAEMARLEHRHADARAALEQALDAFYVRAGVLYHTAWFWLQIAHLSLELGDLGDARAKLALARARFSEWNAPSGLDFCDALAERLQVADARC